MKYPIQKNTVQETLVIPLYGRKMCSEKYPGLFRDENALRLMEQIDYDFSELEKNSRSVMHQFGFLEAACGRTICMGGAGLSENPTPTRR